MSPSPPLHLVHLGRRLATPRNGQWRVELGDPARSVMTDFHDRGMVTLAASLQVDAAVEAMKHAGVRSAFVGRAPFTDRRTGSSPPAPPSGTRAAS